MKKILMSVAVIGFVGAIAAGATGAFFSDTEVSTGNTFTAGAIDLKVDSTQHYNHMICVGGRDEDYTWQKEDGYQGTVDYPAAGSACGGTWEETDLGAQTFFHFGDIKPGDLGENTISLHVINNDAWLRMSIGDIADLDNTETEPESAVDFSVDPLAGELGTNMMFRAWVDNGVLGTDGHVVGKGDNIHQAGEVWIGEGNWMTLAGLKALLAGTVWPVDANQTFYVGMEWKLDSSEGNITQTDSLGFPVMFEVEQMRNNPTPFAP